MLFFFVLSLGYFFINLKFLMSYAEPSGADGYFYLKQILSLSRDGIFYFPDRSLAFALPVFINLFIKNDLLSYQISIALANLGYQWAMYWSVTAFAGVMTSRTKHLVLAAAVLALSALNFAFYELSFIYLKTAISLMFFVFAAGFYWRSSQWLTKERGFALFFFLLSLLCHKTALVLVVLFFLAHVRWSLKGMVAALGFALGALLIFLVVFSRSAQYLSFASTLATSDHEVLFRWIKWLWRARQWHMAVGPVWIVVSILGVVLTRDSRVRGMALFLIGLGVLAWFPLFPHNLDSPLYRLVLLYAALAPIWILSQILLQFRNKWFFAGFGLILVAGMLSLFKWGPTLHGFFKKYSRMDHEVKRLEDFVAPDEHLTCHHGLEFYVDYHTRIRCRSFLADDPNQKAWRVVWAPLQKGPWAKARVELNQKASMRLGKDYFLIPEELWLKLLETYKMNPGSRNPMDKRPSHIEK